MTKSTRRLLSSATLGLGAAAFFALATTGHDAAFLGTPDGHGATPSEDWSLPFGSYLVHSAQAAGGGRPVADAGFDQTAAVDDTVVLDASGSGDPEGDELSLAWSIEQRPAGSVAELDEPAAVKPSFMLDEAGTYVIRLTVSDGYGGSASDTVTVSNLNVAPVADAGADQTVALDETVQLDASGSSDFDGDRLRFTWTVVSAPAKSQAAGAMFDGLQPSFVADEAGEYVVQLIATEDRGDPQSELSSAPDEVTISTVNSRPVGEAGPDQKVAVDQTVILRLEGLTDVDGDLLEERDWSIIIRPPGSAADFPPGKNRRLVIDVDGTYVVQRTVGENDDYDMLSEPDTVILTTDSNLRPVADAGPDQSVMMDDAVKLDGAGSSDVDGDRLSYRWALTTVPMGSEAELSDAAAVSPSFTADKEGTYVAQLIIKDEPQGVSEFSLPDTVVITTGNSRPVADAGTDQKRRKKSRITLDGSGSSDADGDDPRFYDWALVKRPSASNATLTNSTDVNPTFFTDTGKRFVAQLIVNDGQRDSAPDTVVVGPGNMRPVAEAGSDTTAPLDADTGEAEVTLDGSKSFDPGVKWPVLTYLWAVIAAPAGSNPELSDAETPTPTLIANVAGVYVLQLIVTDDDAAPLVSNPDSVVVVVTTDT